MLKRIFCLLTVLLLFCCCSAFAEPRYPAKGGVATDSAAVLSVKVLEDLRTLDKRLDKADAPRLCIVTVDFLDGADVQAYADVLFTRWELPDDTLLLLLCVGEDLYAVTSGKNVDRLVSPQVQQLLLETCLHEPFIGQQYDAAIAAFVPAFAAEVSRACGTTIKTEDLFRNASTSLFDNWAGTQNRTVSQAQEGSFLTRESGGGFSILKVLLIVALVALLIGVFAWFRRANSGEAPAPKPAKAPRTNEKGYPIYFEPRKKKDTPQYFKPREPRS